MRLDVDRTQYRHVQLFISVQLYCNFNQNGRFKEANPTCPVNGHSEYVTAVSYSFLFSNVGCVLTIEDFTGKSGVFASVQMASR